MDDYDYDDDDLLLQRSIDEEFLRAEQLLGHHTSDRSPASRRTPKRHGGGEQQRQSQPQPPQQQPLRPPPPQQQPQPPQSIRTPKRHANEGAPPFVAASSWSGSKHHHHNVETLGSSAAEKIQRKIDELERKLAAASIELTDAERKTEKRRMAQARLAQRGLRTPGSNPVAPPPLQARASPESRPTLGFDLARAGSDGDGGSGGASTSASLAHPTEHDEGVGVSEATAAAPPQTPEAAARVSGLALVMNSLASPTRGLLGATPERVSSEGLPTALQLAGASRRLWHLLSRTTWKREADAAVRLQRVQRGHAARVSARALAQTRDDLIASFLDEHGSQWKRTPSHHDLQASVLPRLDSGARLGVGAFGCVYQPKPVWHFPKSGIAVKAVSLRAREAASGLALEAELLRRVAASAGTHPHVVEMHSAFLVGEHARLALDLASHGDLYEHLWRRKGALPAAEALAFGRQLALGLAHLHRAGVAHRDLKLSNALLFAGDGGGGGGGGSGGGGGGGGGGKGASEGGGCLTLKVADLGLGIHSSQLTPPEELPLEVIAAGRGYLRRHLEPGAAAPFLGATNDPYGTASTMAPEVSMGRWYCPYAADSWSLGVCLLTLAAPREYDEYEMDRTPFYPFACADANEDDEYAVFVGPMLAPPQQRGAPLAAPPGLLMPPGLILGSPPPGLAAPPPSPTVTSSGVTRLLEYRARMCGLEPSGEPPMPPKMLEVLDALLAPEPSMRLPVANAAARLQLVSLGGAASVE